MANLRINFLSYTLHRAVDLTVILPSMCFPEMMEPDPHHRRQAYPVLYLLHGYGNNHATWNGYTSVELYAEERSIAVVMLSAENMAYINHGGDNNYFDFIAHELPEFIASVLPVSGRREDTYIAGLSMGGFGAVVHGLTESRRFAAIGSFSGAVRGLTVARGAEGIDTSALAKACAEENRRIPVYLACGDKDFLLTDNQSFRDELTGLGFDVTWVLGKGFDHEWRFWDQQVEAFLDWIPRSDPFRPAKGQRRKI